jgi:hypothetical protein
MYLAYSTLKYNFLTRYQRYFIFVSVFDMLINAPNEYTSIPLHFQMYLNMSLFFSHLLAFTKKRLLIFCHNRDRVPLSAPKPPVSPVRSRQSETINQRLGVDCDEVILRERYFVSDSYVTVGLDSLNFAKRVSRLSWRTTHVTVIVSGSLAWPPLGIT